MLISQQGQPVQSFEDLTLHIQQTVTLSLPVITGSPFCHHAEYPQLLLLGYEDNSPITSQCLTFNNIWSITYLLLFSISICIPILALITRIHSMFSRKVYFLEKSLFARYMIQIMLISSATLIIVIFIRSQNSLVYPSIHSRYLIDLWVVTPAVLWPLWMGTRAPQGRLHVPGWLFLVRIWVCRALLLLILLIFLFGTWKTVGEIPAARNAARQEQGLINALLKAHITHIYSEYWTCNRIEFESLEHITCGSLTPGLVPKHNRYEPYYDIVSHDPNSSYMFPVSFGNGPLIKGRLRRQRRRYSSFIVNDYIVYQPI